MTLTRTEAAHTFSSTTGGETYQFEVAVDEQSQVQVRNIRSPLGLIQDTVTGLPQTVVDDIAEAVEVVQQQLTESEVTTGSVIFTGETSQAATIAAGLLNNTNYRVLYETPDGTWMRTTGKTTTGFTVVAPSAYGTVAVPLTVDWTVITNPAINSSLSGSETLTDADVNSKAVVFASALETDDYRVHLEKDDFYLAKVINKTKQGFTLVLGHSLGAGETATIGYDVFVG